MSALQYEMVETEERFRAMVARLEKSDLVAADLEADSMFHFREKVCLVQLAAGDRSYVVDPFRIPDLTPLRPMFADPSIRKVFHGADYDVRSLHRDYGIEIENLFDTQLASRFLGAESTGLEAVVRKRLGVKLNKKYQKKDWSERPLSEKMVEYAARDAVCLLPLAEILLRELEEKGRVEWVREECELLSKVRVNDSDGEPLFVRFKGAGKLKRRRLAVLEAILRLRWTIAEEKDRPLFKVFSNASAMKLAAAAPTDLEQLKKSKALSGKQAAMFGEPLAEAVRAALDIPEKKLPVYPRKKPPVLDPRVPARVQALKAWRDRCAKKLGVEPPVVATKAIITSLAVGKPGKAEELDSVDEMKNWQRREFGEQILQVLSKCR